MTGQKKFIKISITVVLMAIFLYISYNAIINYRDSDHTEYYLRLSLKPNVSDVGELYQSKTGGPDVYLAETDYRWDKSEPGKLFLRVPIADYESLTTELIEYLPLVRRIGEYWQSGQIETALNLAEDVISKGDKQLTQRVLDQLSDFRSSEIASVLTRSYNGAKSYFGNDGILLRAQIIEQINPHPIFTPLLIAALEDPFADVRFRAAETLAQLGNERAVEPLIAQLNSHGSFRRSRVAEMLAQLGNERAVEPLINLLNVNRIVHFFPGNEDDLMHYRFERSQVALALGQLGSERAVEPLLAQISNPDQEDMVSSQAVEALVQLGSERAVELLISLLKDQNKHVRSRAARALGQLGSEHAVESLIALLKDQDDLVRFDTVRALVQLGSDRAVEPITSLLNDQQSFIRSEAARALEQLGRERVAEPLNALLKNQDGNGRSEAAVALARLDSERAVEPLIALLNDQSSYDVRSQAALALGKLGSERAIQPLIRLLKEHNILMGSSVRSQAALALAEIGSQRATEPLIERLKDRDEKMRQALLLALGQLHDPQALSAITEIFNTDPRRSVRQAAALALLAFAKDDGLTLLHDLATHSIIDKRLQAAELFGRIATEQGTEFLLTLLDDSDSEVILEAIRSLGKIKAKTALAKIHALLQHKNIKIRKTALEAIVSIASADSITVLKEQLFNTDNSPAFRRVAFKGLAAIATDEAIDVALEWLKQQDTEIVFEERAYRWLGDAQNKNALDLLQQRLTRLENQYRKWRTIRDTYGEEFSREQEENWLKQVTEAQPNRYIALPLAYAIAQIDPDNSGFDLLSHDLADVRHGAWLGLAKVSTVERLKRLHREREASDDPIFKHAAYRAIDHMLIWLETYGNAKDLAQLEAWYPEIEDVEGVGTRTEWTIDQLQRFYR